MNFFEKAVVFIATGCYTGYIPASPGTWGALVGLVFCYWLSLLHVPVAFIVLCFMTVFSVWVAGLAEKIIQQKDSSCIVIDEVVGMAVTLVGLPFAPLTVVTGFILFRILDISKPFPIRYFDKKISGGVGIVSDDIAAGLLGNLLLRFFF
jgi:phosphatidylglycerophosphatase A